MWIFIKSICSVGNMTNKIKMKKYLIYIGLALALTGALLLVISQLAGWTDINAIQLSAFGSIIAGIIMHVAALKRDSKY